MCHHEYRFCAPGHNAVLDAQHAHLLQKLHCPLPLPRLCTSLHGGGEASRIRREASTTTVDAEHRMLVHRQRHMPSDTLLRRRSGPWCSSRCLVVAATRAFSTTSLMLRSNCVALPGYGEQRCKREETHPSTAAWLLTTWPTSKCTCLRASSAACLGRNGTADSGVPQESYGKARHDAFQAMSISTSHAFNFEYQISGPIDFAMFRGGVGPPNASSQ